MIKILFWNINNFSKNKINKPDTVGEPNNAVESQDRRDHIVDQVFGSQVPHIFVIVEVYSRVREVGYEGTVLNSNRNAGQGVIELLGRIRTRWGNDFCIVPPLNLGRQGFREAVAVIYDSTRLQFIGPNLLSQIMGVYIPISRAPDQPAVNNLVNYDDNWVNGLPLEGGRTHQITIGPNNHDIREDQFAGQWEFHDANNERINFPNADNRSPFLTRFLEVNVPNPRIINLYAVHTSPANQAVGQLSRIPAIAAATPIDTVDVIVGDFNVDPFDHLNDYNSLLAGAHPFTMALDPRNGGAGLVIDARRPYCTTHLLPVAQATPFNNTGQTNVQHNVYPRFGYMGSMGGQAFQNPVMTGAIDNIFTRYGGGVAGGPAQNISIVNTITGKPYNAVVAPGGVTAELTGGLAYNHTLYNVLPVLGAGYPDPTAGEPAQFRQWNNFGRIHSVSDHLALCIDV